MGRSGQTINPDCRKGQFTFILCYIDLMQRHYPSRSLTENERTLARSVFGEAIDLQSVRINLKKWWWFQPKSTAMAPDGELWFHPQGHLYSACFCTASLRRQAFFVHELVHIWQHQQGIFLPLARHPFCRYDYWLKPGKPFRTYGIEQQAEIVRHAFLLRNGVTVAGKPGLDVYERLIPFLTPV